MSKKHRPRKVVPASRASGPPALPSSAAASVRRAERMLADGEWSRAVAVLQSVRRHNPHDPSVLAYLSDAYTKLGDAASRETVAEELAKVDPRPDVVANLGHAYMATMRPALAMQTFREYLAQWPGHEHADAVRKVLPVLREAVAQVAAPCGLDPDGEGLKVAAENDRVAQAIGRNQMKLALELALDLEGAYPCLGAAHNNVAICCMALSQPEQAAEAARRALEVQPDNIHALSNLVKLSVLANDLESAREYAALLTASQASADRKALKIAEALSYLGDDEGVLRAYESEGRNPAEHDPMLCHLAAVAAAHLGRADEARRLWQHAGRCAELADRAERNLADLDKPAAERDSAWAFPLPEWIGRPAVADLEAALRQRGRQRTGQTMAEALIAFVEKRPGALKVAPALLDRGDPTGRQMAYVLGAALRTPDLLAALRDFALSDRGPDGMRRRAATIAIEGGVLPREPVRMWMDGRWQEMRHIVWDITNAPQPSDQSPEVLRLLGESIDAMRRDDPMAAERLLKQALEIEPEDRMLLNNLSAAYRAQGRREESREIVRTLFERHPDYLFARVGMAHLLIEEGRLADATAVLDPLLSRPELHITELAALANAEVLLLMESGEYVAADRWLDMWEGADPDDPVLQGMRAEVASRGILSILEEVAKRSPGGPARRAA